MGEHPTDGSDYYGEQDYWLQCEYLSPAGDECLDDDYDCWDNLWAPYNQCYDDLMNNYGGEDYGDSDPYGGSDPSGEQDYWYQCEYLSPAGDECSDDDYDCWDELWGPYMQCYDDLMNNYGGEDTGNDW